MLFDELSDSLINNILKRQERINMEVIKKIASSILLIGNVNISDAYLIANTMKYGTKFSKIKKELSKLTKLQESAISNMFDELARKYYKQLKPLYEFGRVDYIPYSQNKDIQRLVKSIQRQTLGTYKNLSNSSAFMIRNPKNRKLLIPTTLSKTYDTIIDEAVQAVITGNTDYSIAMRKSLVQLIDSGIRTVNYESETGRLHSQRLDSAVKRNLLGAVRQLGQQMNDIVGEQTGANAKEISVHAFSAPDHEPVQGRQFSLQEYDNLQSGLDSMDLQGNHYAGFNRPIGEWNCRHFAMSTFIGMSPNYTDQQLQSMKIRNQSGYTDGNDIHYTMYECTQLQRKYELKIRRAKEGVVAANSAGDSALANKYQSKVLKLSNEYKIFSNSCKLPTRFENTVVEYYN